MPSPHLNGDLEQEERWGAPAGLPAVTLNMVIATWLCRRTGTDSHRAATKSIPLANLSQGQDQDWMQMFLWKDLFHSQDCYRHLEGPQD